MKQAARIIRNNVPLTLLSNGLTYGEPISVSTVADARLLPDPPPQAIIINSAGAYYWDSASTASDNGVTVIKITAITTGRYRSPANGAISPSATGIVIAGDCSVGSQAAKVYTDSYGAFGAQYAGVWLGAITPALDNVALAGDGTSTSVNGLTRVQIAEDGTVNAVFTSDGLRVGDGTDPTERLEVAGRSVHGVNTGKVFLDSDLNAPTTSGGVWLGSIVPAAGNCHIRGNATDLIFNAASGVTCQIGGAGKAYLTTTGLRVGSGVAPTEALDVTGNAIVSNSVAVGTTSAPSEKLDVVGRAKFGVNTGKVILDSDLNGATTTGGIWMGTATPTAGNCNIRGTAADLIFNASSGHTFQIGGAGKAYVTTTGLRVGSGVAPTVALDVTGAAAVSGNCVLGSTTSAHQIIGSQRWTTRTLAGNLVIDTTTTDMIILVDTSAARAVTLPTATNGRVIIIKDKTGSAAANNITVTRAGSESIEGVAGNYVISTNWAAVRLVSDGTNWFLC
jgi:hypothetical protein